MYMNMYIKFIIKLKWNYFIPYMSYILALIRLTVLGCDVIL